MLPLAPRLDHVVVNVLNDLDGAADRWRRLGFQLTPRGHHTLGTSNNLAIFGTDYLELLGYERGKEGSRVDLVDTPPGLSGLVFKPPADPGFAAALREAGLQADPPREFSRPVELPDGPHDAAFRTVNLSGVVRSGRVFFCHHHTPELVWRDEWRQHPNGVTGIAGFTIATPDPARTAVPFTKMFGPLRAIEGGLVLDAGTAEIRFLTLAASEERMVALEFRTASLDAVRDALAVGGIQTTGAEVVTVPAVEASGVQLTFTA